MLVEFLVFFIIYVDVFIIFYLITNSVGFLKQIYFIIDDGAAIGRTELAKNHIFSNV